MDTPSILRESVLKEAVMSEIYTIGIDLAKTVFQLCAFDRTGKKLVNRSLRRNQVIKFLSNTEPCLVGMEACGSSHYWAREIEKLGHEVKLMRLSMLSLMLKRIRMIALTRKPFVKQFAGQRCDSFQLKVKSSKLYYYFIVNDKA